MAGPSPGRVKQLVVTALVLCSSIVCHPQAGPTGSLSGKLTDLHSTPLAGTTVILRDQATGAETRTITKQDGTYRFNGLTPGRYTMEADRRQLGHGELRDIVISPGFDAHVQAAMLFDPQPPAAVHSVFLKNQDGYPLDSPTHHP